MSDRALGEAPADLRVAVLGAGSAAAAGALEAARLGARVTVVESGTLGGTCVNVGCVPSKALLRSAHVAHVAGHHPYPGIARREPGVDRAALADQHQSLVRELRREKYETLLRETPGVEVVSGHGRFVAPGRLEVMGTGGAVRELSFDRVLVATGSAPAVPAVPGLDPEDGGRPLPYWTSTHALAAREAPDHLLVLGGGYVGLELAQAFLRLGSRVTVIARSRLLSAMDPALGQGLQAALEAEGVTVRTGITPERVRFDGTRFTVELGDETVVGDRLLVATGRRPRSAGLGLDAVGVETDADGAIRVDPRLRTTAPGVYAAGDCTDLPRFVYVAAASGTRAARNMAGATDEALDLSALPAVVFTDPQVATVGWTEAQAERAGLRVESRTLPAEHIPRARVDFDPRPSIKLVAEAGAGRLLGAHVLGRNAGEVIQTAALALRHRMSVDDLAGQIVPYLTLAEGLKLCAQSFQKDVRRLSCCAG